MDGSPDSLIALRAEPLRQLMRSPAWSMLRKSPMPAFLRWTPARTRDQPPMMATSSYSRIASRGVLGT